MISSQLQALPRALDVSLRKDVTLHTMSVVLVVQAAMDTITGPEPVTFGEFHAAVVSRAACEAH